MSKSDSLVGRGKQLLLGTGNGAADVHFLVGEGNEKELLPAHKAIMEKASDVFEAMFRFENVANYGMVPSEEIEPIEVPDVEVGAFKAMLSFIYAEDLSGLNGDNVVAVLYAAKKYNVDGLLFASVHFPIPKLSNVFLTFDQTRFLGEEDFARRCLEYIDVNAGALLLSKAFLQIEQKLLCEILERDELMISKEIAIWNAARRWADKKCRQNGKVPSGQNRRAMLGPALFKIRFPLILQADFIQIIVPFGELTDAEQFGVHQYHSHANALPEQQYALQFPTQQRCRSKNQGLGFVVVMLTIEKLSEFAQEDDNSRRLGEAVYISGLSWKILALSRTDEFGEKCLDFFLHCNAEIIEFNWCCVISSTSFRIGSQKIGKNDYRGFLSHVFCSNSNICLITSMSFEELMWPNNGWYDEAKDMVVLDIFVNAFEVCGASPMPYCYNC